MNFEKLVNDNTFLITGGTGSFGYQMTQKLLKYNPNEIRIFSRDEDKHRQMKSDFNSEKLSFFLGDVRDYERISEATKDIDIVFHAGALKQIPAVEFNPLEAIKTNILGAFNVMKACAENQVQKVIGISTDKAVKPVNAMGMTKALMEKLFLSNDIQTKNTQFSCVRYGNVLGSRGSVIPIWDKLIEQNKPISVTHPNMRRFFLTLDQATDLVLYAVKSMNKKEIFVLKAPACYIKDMAKAWAEIKGKKDYPIEYIGIRAGEKLDEVLISEEELRHCEEEKDYYVIERENLLNKDLDINSENKYGDLDIREYSTATTKLLNYEQILKLMSEIKWIK